MSPFLYMKWIWGFPVILLGVLHTFLTITEGTKWTENKIKLESGILDIDTDIK